jgi:hypothetical protein
MLESPPDSTMDMNSNGSTYPEFPFQETQARESCGLLILAHLEFSLEPYICWEEIWEVRFIDRLSIALPNTVVRKSRLTIWPHVGSSPTKRMSLRLFSVRAVSGSFSIQSNLAFSSSVFGFPCTSPYFYNPHISYFTVLTCR